MSQAQRPGQNIFLEGPLTLLFVKTATPIILVMVINGAFTLIDAYFLGAYVGADALTAVTLMFPIYMVLIALTTLVSNGYSSVLARLLGADDRLQAGEAFTGAITLSIVVCIFLICLFLIGGDIVILAATNGSEELARMGYTYLSILIFASPLAFLLALAIDGLRCEGRLAVMACITLILAFLDIAFDYLFIVEMGLGVAGSAIGSVTAKFVTLGIWLLYRRMAGSKMILQRSQIRTGVSRWPGFLALGAPTSLNYVGISLSAASILINLQLWANAEYEVIAGAYGIVTRLMTFTFMPLLGISIAFQTIAGNNFGARAWHRSNRSLKIAATLALVYCGTVQFLFYIFRNDIGFLFVNDACIADEIGRILPFVTAMLFLFGPQTMISAYFQATGEARPAAIIGLSRAYLFSIPLSYILPVYLGEPGLWYAWPLSEILVLCLTALTLYRRTNREDMHLGIFRVETAMPTASTR